MISCKGDCNQGRSRCPHANLCKETPSDKLWYYSVEIIVLISIISVIVWSLNV